MCLNKLTMCPWDSKKQWCQCVTISLANCGEFYTLTYIHCIELYFLIQIVPLTARPFSSAQIIYTYSDYTYIKRTIEPNFISVALVIDVLCIINQVEC